MLRSALHDKIVAELGHAYDVASESPVAKEIPWANLIKLLISILSMILPLLVEPQPPQPKDGQA